MKEINQYDFDNRKNLKTLYISEALMRKKKREQPVRIFIILLAVLFF